MKIKLGQFDRLVRQEISQQKERLPRSFKNRKIKIVENVFSFSIIIEDQNFFVNKLQSEVDLKKEIKTIINQIIILNI